ncbi:MAG: cytochrome c biogenesis protein CcsA, partial [Pseudomonadales bacterium]|nr:cytochrome c biogenesis protein CcsA [Pseudomonadales bacterium]
ALLLAFENRQLKRKGSFSLLKALPPLQTMESLLFELLWVGLIILTLSILTGFLYLEDMFAQHIVHHTLITLASWVVFVILLWGRHQLGWRGRTAIGWTLSGFGLLALGYFGSKLVAEIILQRM